MPEPATFATTDQARDDNRHVATVIPGDGIGPEVVEATLTAIEATGVDIRWEFCNAGLEALRRGEDELPSRTLAGIRRNGVALKGPLASTHRGSVNAALRRELDLFASVRPCRTLNRRTGRPGCDLQIVRENHEDVFVGIEFSPGTAAAARLRALLADGQRCELGPDAGVSLRPISMAASERVLRLAFQSAADDGRGLVTVGHKANVMKASDGLFLEAGRRVAREFPQIEYAEELIDTLCGRLVSDPRRYEVVVLPNLFGDIVSDIGAALAGGTGMAPGANVGEDCVVYEAVHGTAERLVGSGMANPVGLMLAAASLLRRIGERHCAIRLEDALREVIEDPALATYDQAPSGRPVGTAEFGQLVASRIVGSRFGAGPP